ncbi:MAG: insulinase family protein [Proteobacteria bacterium]|nr:insulinase family protein [Pseudomonadota bacterium]
MAKSFRGTLAAALLTAALAACAQISAPKLDGLKALPNPFAKHKAPATAPVGAPAPAPTLPPRPARKGTWTQDRSDVPPDPAIRYGSLPNGMRYMIRHNATPPGQASLRLRIAAGALNERDDQAGLMHFIEHMAFNGSTHVPEGEMVKILQRHGLAFGPDTNAFTAFDQTVYQLDLPEADGDTLDTGLMLMRETAGELSLDPAAIDKERGVILSEERLRDTPSLRIARREYDFLYKGDLLPRRFPIGDVNVIRNAGRAPFKDLYDTYYRPDRAVLVAVGDFDVAAMEAKIKAQFSDWSARGPDRPDPDLGPVAPRGPEVKLVVEPGGPSNVQLAWLNPPDRRDDTRALRRERAIRQVGFAVLNRRLGRLARAAKPPFIAAASQRFTNINTADVTQVALTANPGGWREALEAGDAEVRRLVQYGVQQAEVDREVAEYKAALEAVAAGAATRKTADLATELSDSIENDEVVSSPAEDLAEFEASTKDLKAEAVSALIKAQFTGQGPLVMITSPAPVDGGEAAIGDAFAKMRATPVTPPVAIEAKTWSYTDFGAPGQVAERKDVYDLDTTFVRFANGVRLTVKPTKFRDDEVLVSVRFGDGYQDLPKDRVTPVWAAGLSFADGGLKRLTAEEVEQVLASRVYSANLGVSDDAFTLNGTTRAEDFELQMQVLAAYVTDAAWRPEPFERMRTYGDTLLAQLASTPQGVFSRDGDALLHGGDPRWAFPNRAQMDQAKLEDLKALIGRPLAEAPIEVVVVGDVNIEEAIRLTALTFGALPPRKDAPAPADGKRVAFPPPTPEPVALTHNGRADQAIGYVAWPTTDFPSDPANARALRMVEQILQLRLLDDLREKQAVTYSPQTQLNASWDFPGYGYVSASIEAPPEKLGGFFTTVQAIAKDLRERPVGADELQRALKPRIETLMKAQATNEYWLGQLAGAQTDPRKLDSIRSTIAGLQRVGPAEVQRAAQRWLKDETAWKLVITPAPKPATP